MLKKILYFPFRILDAFKGLDFLAPLAMRAFLAPVLWFKGMGHLAHMDKLSDFLYNDLHLASADALAQVLTYGELAGAVCLALGIAVRLFSIPIMVASGMSAVMIHMAHGWYYIAPETAQASVRLTKFMEWLQHYFPGRHAFITELGQPVMMLSGVEHVAVFFILGLSLFFTGAGRWFSVDYWVAKKFK